MRSPFQALRALCVIRWRTTRSVRLSNSNAKLGEPCTNTRCPRLRSDRHRPAIKLERHVVGHHRDALADEMRTEYEIRARESHHAQSPLFNREMQMKGIRRDRYGFRAYVKIGQLQKEKRFKPDTTTAKMQAWRDEARVALRKIPQPASGRGGTFGADVKAYLAQIKPTIAKATFRSRECELDHYLTDFRQRPTSDITRAALLELRTAWMTTGKAKRHGQKGASAKTVRNREGALRHFFHCRFGKKAATPLDDLPPLPKTPAQPKFVSVARIKAVLKRLTDSQTRARFMVLVATGQRPAQLRRAQPGDVDLRRRLWLVRRAKGGNPIPVVLTDDMIAAWKAFKRVKAWGDFEGSEYAKALYAAGWPKDVPPYNAKHTVAITLAESGAEWEDIKDFFGHTDVKTTRIYTGLIAARGRAISGRLAGRLGW